MTMHSINANAQQVGGEHYKAAYQHWDLVADTGMGYFEGQITKYIVRHRQKNGLQDVQKAQHFLRKLIELVTDGRVLPPSNRGENLGTFSANFVAERNKTTQLRLTKDEHIVLYEMLFWHGTNNLEEALYACERIAAEYAPS